MITKTTMHRRTFLTLATAATATLAAGPARAAENGDGFEAVLFADSRNDLSAADRVAGLEARGFVPVKGDERGQAADLLGDGLSMFEVRPLSGAPTTKAFRKASRVNIRANIDRPSGNGRTSSLMRLDEPAGPVYAYILQGTPGGRITFSAACAAPGSINGFLARLVPDLAPAPPEGAFVDRFDIQLPQEHPNTRARRILTRIDTAATRAITGPDYNAAGSFIIKTNPA